MKQTIGQKIIDFRADHNLTRKQMAIDLGYSDFTIKRWENNIAVPDAFATKDLCDYMNISLNDFLKGICK